MKKIVLLFVLMMLQIVANAQSVEINGIYYNLVQKGGVNFAEVDKNPNYYSGAIIIPSSVMHEGVEYSVTRIGASAFGACTGLNSVDIPNSVTFIGDGAFCYCPNLTSIIIPNSVLTIGNNAFENCYNLSSISISDRTTSIGDYAFNNCRSLTSADIPNSVTNIGAYAFQNCGSLTSVNIPNNVTYIDKCAFYNCRSLISVIIPDKVTFNYGVFSGCSGLTSVTFLNGVKSIAISMFSGCSSLTSVTIPNSIESIQHSAFYNCTSLTSIDIPNSITKIGHDAFSGCSGLTSVSIPINLSSIEEGTFQNCSGLTAITIPNSVKYIWDKAFEGCSGLTTLIICNSCNIYNRSFASCDKLTDVFCYNNFFSSSSNAFQDSYIEYATLHVPTAFIDSYKTAEPWKYFKSIVPLPQLIYKVDGEIYKSYTPMFGETIIPEAAPTKEGYTFSGWSEIPETMPAHDVIVTGTFTVNKYKLTYKVDDVEYKTYEIEYGSTITPEAAPSKEGYTFSGWSKIPETMPAHDVIVTGTFTINKYKLTYKVDGVEYKSYNLEYGSAVTIEVAPTKEGYTFSGWSEVPETMPAHNVTVTGSFTVNKYTITYMIDNEVYQTENVDYGSTITPPEAPEREGYTFEWIDVPETMPAHDVTVTGTFTVNKYKLNYMVDDVEYKNYEIEFGTTITPEAEPTKEGNTFSGWSKIPETMPAHDVTVTGTFTINKYKLTYKVDDVEYKTYEIEYGSTITPEAAPSKEGYTFSGWSKIPETMPAHDVTVTGTFSKGQFKLTYIVDDQIYKTIYYDYNDVITPEPAPTKEGYTFYGWSEIPETMPAHDVIVTGTFTVNKYKLTYKVDDAEYKTYEVEFGATISPEPEPTKEGYTFSGWSEIPETMPAHNLIVTGTFEKAFIPGDANGDGLVNVTDIVATVNYIMEKPSDNFNKDAADLNGDGVVNVTDIVMMVSIIMNGNGGSSRRAAATSSQLIISRNNIQLRNAEAYTAAQFDINLCDGQSISNVVLNVSSDHSLYWKMVDANTYRVVVYSMTNAAFRANSDNLFTVFMTGSQNATISNELLIKADGTTGIDAIRTEAENGNVYDLNGRQVKTPRKGVYIINGRKVVVK